MQTTSVCVQQLGRLSDFYENLHTEFLKCFFTHTLHKSIDEFLHAPFPHFLISSRDVRYRRSSYNISD